MGAAETMVLVVDDSESVRSSIRRILEQSELGVRVLEANDGAEGLSIALGGDVDIVISDILMPNLDGIQLLRGIRKRRDLESLPVILITSQDEEERRNSSFEAGANDYISKPFSPVELISRIGVQLRLRQLQVELKRANDRYRTLEQQDELTGLHNRRAFLDAGEREVSRSRRHNYSVSFLVLDIDDFRKVNQNVGELVGDAIITEMGQLLTSNLRSADLLARLGGPKFGVILPRADASYARATAERLQQAVRGHTFPGHRCGELTVCVGSITYPNGEHEALEEILNQAQAALERAKAAGRNQMELV